MILTRVSTDLDTFSTFSTTKLMWTALFSVGEEIPQSPSEKLEMALISRWEGLCVAPTAGGVGSFSRNQLVYLTRLVKELIACKNMIIYVSQALVKLIIRIQLPELSLGIFVTYFHMIADNYIIVSKSRSGLLNIMIVGFWFSGRSIKLSKKKSLFSRKNYS